MPKKCKPASIALRPVLHIFCEGSKTEPHYFEQYRQRFCVVPSRIKVEPTKKNNPVGLVQEAIKKQRQKDIPKTDQFWVIFDREAESSIPEAIHAQARKMAEEHGVQIALSNICFEVWLLLHRRKNVAQCDCCDTLLKRREFRDLFPSYEKGEPIHFSKEEITAARKNAVLLNKQTIDGADPSWTVPSRWNPYTDVYKVLDAIDTFVSNNF